MKQFIRHIDNIEVIAGIACRVTVGAATTYVAASWSIGAIVALVIVTNMTFWILRWFGPLLGLACVFLILYFGRSKDLIRAQLNVPETVRHGILTTAIAVFIGAALMSAAVVEWNLWDVIPPGANFILAGATGIALGWYANLALAPGDIAPKI